MNIEKKIEQLENELQLARQQKENEYDAMRLPLISPLLDGIKEIEWILQFSRDEEYKKSKSILLEEMKTELSILIATYPCMNHQDELIDEDVDKWWVNYHYRCKKCGRKHVFRGCC